MNYSFSNKNVSISGKNVITNWLHLKVVSPENLQEKTEANETAKKEIIKQKDVTPTSSNAPIAGVA